MKQEARKQRGQGKPDEKNKKKKRKREHTVKESNTHKYIINMLQNAIGKRRQANKSTTEFEKMCNWEANYTDKIQQADRIAQWLVDIVAKWKHQEIGVEVHTKREKSATGVQHKCLKMEDIQDMKSITKATQEHRICVPVRINEHSTIIYTIIVKEFFTIIEMYTSNCDEKTRETMKKDLIKKLNSKKPMMHIWQTIKLPPMRRIGENQIVWINIMVLLCETGLIRQIKWDQLTSTVQNKKAHEAIAGMLIGLVCNNTQRKEWKGITEQQCKTYITQIINKCCKNSSPGIEMTTKKKRQKKNTKTGTTTNKKTKQAKLSGWIDKRKNNPDRETKSTNEIKVDNILQKVKQINAITDMGENEMTDDVKLRIQELKQMMERYNMAIRLQDGHDQLIKMSRMNQYRHEDIMDAKQIDCIVDKTQKGTGIRAEQKNVTTNIHDITQKIEVACHMYTQHKTTQKNIIVQLKKSLNTYEENREYSVLEKAAASLNGYQIDINTGSIKEERDTEYKVDEEWSGEHIVGRKLRDITKENYLITAFEIRLALHQYVRANRAMGIIDSEHVWDCVKQKAEVVNKRVSDMTGIERKFMLSAHAIQQQFFGYCNTDNIHWSSFCYTRDKEFLWYDAYEHTAGQQTNQQRQQAAEEMLRKTGERNPGTHICKTHDKICRIIGQVTPQSARTCGAVVYRCGKQVLTNEATQQEMATDIKKPEQWESVRYEMLYDILKNIVRIKEENQEEETTKYIAADEIQPQILPRHKKACKNIQIHHCAICSERIKGHEKLISHIMHEPCCLGEIDRDNWQQCQVAGCTERFDRISDLRLHVQEKHEGRITTEYRQRLRGIRQQLVWRAERLNSFIEWGTANQNREEMATDRQEKEAVKDTRSKKNRVMPSKLHDSSKCVSKDIGKAREDRDVDRKSVNESSRDQKTRDGGKVDRKKVKRDTRDQKMKDESTERNKKRQKLSETEKKRGRDNKKKVNVDTSEKRDEGVNQKRRETEEEEENKEGSEKEEQKRQQNIQSETNGKKETNRKKCREKKYKWKKRRRKKQHNKNKSITKLDK